jgi:hypothetical protein
MRRFGGADPFLDLLARARAIAPELGVRSNVIVGFPGETQADVETLEGFLTDADLDAVGVFAYSDEEGTEAATMPGKVSAAAIAARHARVTDLVEQLTAARAERRVGEAVEVLVEEVQGRLAYGCAAHQQPDADGACVVRLPEPAGDATPAGGATGVGVAVGDLVAGRVVAAEGVDLVVEPTSVLGSPARRGAGPPTGATVPAGSVPAGAVPAGAVPAGAVAAGAIPPVRSLASLRGSSGSHS